MKRNRSGFTLRAAALALYNDLVHRGAYDVAYCQLLEDVGLRLFTEDLDGCIRDAYSELRRLCLAYDAGELAA